MEHTQKIQIFLDKRDLGIIQPNNSYGTKNFNDWYVNIVFIKTNKLVDDYIQTYIDPLRVTMQRQLVNPYFMEYGFFENIQSFSGATGENSNQINIITKAKTYNIQIQK
jgi:hypothetical protein